MLLDNAAVEPAKGQVRCNNSCDSDCKVRDALLYPWFTRNRDPDNHGKEREIFEESQSEVRLLSCNVAGACDRFDIEKENIGQQKAHADGNE